MCKLSWKREANVLYKEIGGNKLTRAETALHRTLVKVKANLFPWRRALAHNNMASVKTGQSHVFNQTRGAGLMSQATQHRLHPLVQTELKIINTSVN